MVEIFQVILVAWSCGPPKTSLASYAADPTAVSNYVEHVRKRSHACMYTGVGERWRCVIMNGRRVYIIYAICSDARRVGFLRPIHGWMSSYYGGMSAGRLKAARLHRWLALHSHLRAHASTVADTCRVRTSRTLRTFRTEGKCETDVAHFLSRSCAVPVKMWPGTTDAGTLYRLPWHFTGTTGNFRYHWSTSSVHALNVFRRQVGSTDNDDLVRTPSTTTSVW